MKSLSLSDTILSRTLYYTIIVLNRTLPKSLVVLDLRYSTKYVYFVSRSITLRIVSYSFLVYLSFDLSSFIIKSKAIDFYSLIGVSYITNFLYSVYYTDLF